MKFLRDWNLNWVLLNLLSEKHEVGERFLWVWSSNLNLCPKHWVADWFTWVRGPNLYLFPSFPNPRLVYPQSHHKPKISLSPIAPQTLAFPRPSCIKFLYNVCWSHASILWPPCHMQMPFPTALNFLFCQTASCLFSFPLFLWQRRRTLDRKKLAILWAIRRLCHHMRPVVNLIQKTSFRSRSNTFIFLETYWKK